MKNTKPLSVEIEGKGKSPVELFDLAKELLRNSVRSEIIYLDGVVRLYGIWEPDIEHSVKALEAHLGLAISINNLKVQYITENNQLLEPIMALAVKLREEYAGDLVGDISKRRGLIMGMKASDNGLRIILSHVPLSELIGYTSDLSKITAGTAKAKVNMDQYY